MTTPTTRRGSPRPGNGGKRAGAGRKPRIDPDHPARTEQIALRVDADLKAFYNALPLSERKRLIEAMQTTLRRAFIDSLT